MIQIFAEHPTNRLKFVLDFCFKEKGQDYILIHQHEDWDPGDDTALSYSNQQMDCDYAIEPLGLLNESDIDPFLKLEKYGEKLTLRGDSDPLSVIFYILSRYEEYQEHQADQHGRFLSTSSAQFELNVLHSPICDIIVRKLWQKLGLDYQPVKEKFEFVPSFDIDVAWAFKHRPLWRRIGALKNGQFLQRLGVLLFGEKDPYDTYNKIVEISARVDRIICFAPLSDYGPYDKNISHKNEHYRSLIRGLNADGGMGLHPGYQAHLNEDILQEEKARIEEILGREMVKSRFHFLRLDVPSSYPLMIKIGFKKDYSMGYADQVGFRAGTSFPFYYFNLNTNETTDYLIFPFAYLDNAFKDYLKLDVDSAILQMKDLVNEVKEVGGVFMCIWHNHSINDQGEWKGWYKLLEETIKCAKS